MAQPELVVKGIGAKADPPMIVVVYKTTDRDGESKVLKRVFKWKIPQISPHEVVDSLNKRFPRLIEKIAKTKVWITPVEAWALLSQS